MESFLTTSNKPVRPGYHPSALSRQLCPRLEALTQLGYLTPVQNIDGRLQRIFDNGHHMHARFQKWTRDMKLVVKHPKLKGLGPAKTYAQEVPLTHPVGVNSRCDDILNLEEGWWDVVDYKSINQDNFRTLLRPISYHEKQLTVYLGLVDYKFEGKPPKKLRGRLVYEGKSDQSLKEFVVPWDDQHRALFDTFIGTLQSINEAVANEAPLSVPCTCGKCEAYDLAALKDNPRVVAV